MMESINPALNYCIERFSLPKSLLSSSPSLIDKIGTWNRFRSLVASHFRGRLASGNRKFTISTPILEYNTYSFEYRTLYKVSAMNQTWLNQNTSKTLLRLRSFFPSWICFTMIWYIYTIFFAFWEGEVSVKKSENSLVRVLNGSVWKCDDDESTRL